MNGNISEEVISLEESNRSFISEVGPCELCGGGDAGGSALSRLRLVFGYGSRHDGERIEFAICGECADRIYQAVVQQKGSGAA